MSEKWKNLLASSRLVAKGLDESSDKQIQASIESLSANFRDMLSLLNNCCLNLWLETYGLEPDALAQSEHLLMGFLLK